MCTVLLEYAPVFDGDEKNTVVVLEETAAADTNVGGDACRSSWFDIATANSPISKRAISANCWVEYQFLVFWSGCRNSRDNRFAVRTRTKYIVPSMPQSPPCRDAVLCSWNAVALPVCQSCGNVFPLSAVPRTYKMCTKGSKSRWLLISIVYEMICIASLPSPVSSGFEKLYAKWSDPGSVSCDLKLLMRGGPGEPPIRSVSKMLLFSLSPIIVPSRMRTKQCCAFSKPYTTAMFS